MDYSKFKLEDFLSNREFIKWATNPKEDLDTFWNNWVANHPEQKETILEAKKIVRNLDFNGIEFDNDDRQEILGKVLSGKYSGSRGKIYVNNHKQKQLKLNLLKIAASIVIFLCVSYFLITSNMFSVSEESMVALNEIVKSTKRGEKLTVILPDSSKVKLNSESRLTYTNQFGNKRRVKLWGEAYFEVQHNSEKPFTVETPNLSTTVLGTSFNVKAYAHSGSESVSLVSGKVSVKKNNSIVNQTIILSPNEKIQYSGSDTSLSYVTYDIDDILWKDGVLIFNEADLSTFVSKIERWYDVDVVIDRKVSKNWHFNGHFENESLKVVLESLKYSVNIDYKIENRKVIIRTHT